MSEVDGTRKEELPRAAASCCPLPTEERNWCFLTSIMGSSPSWAHSPEFSPKVMYVKYSKC